MSNRYCSAPQCSIKKSKDVSLHLFPKNKKLLKECIVKLRIDKPLSKHMTICSLHFKESDYIYPESDERGTGKDKIVHENIQEVLEEVKSNVTNFTSKLQKVDYTSETSSDSEAAEEPEEEINLETCSVRAYIEHTVGQLLLAALTILERERPENPIKWLAEYLLYHKDKPLLELFGEPPPEQETSEPIKLPEHVKKVIMEDLEDLEIEVVNKFV